MKIITTLKIKVVLSAVMILLTTTITAYATDPPLPSQAEVDAYKAAKALYMQSLTATGVQDPEETDPPPTQDELRQQAITAFNDFLTTYTESQVRDSAQYYIGLSYFGLTDHANAKAAFDLVVSGYPDSLLVDDALYQIGFIDFTLGDYVAAQSEFEGVITDYEANQEEKLTHKVPFAYFMVGECLRMQDDMPAARAKYNEVIVKFPAHSQAGRAYKRLSP
ncbi:tol-pal system YbgF family protein [Thermodesulfobacteriota bacterium]